MHAPEPADPQAWVDVVMHSNPVILAAHYTVAADEHQVSAARAGTRPHRRRPWQYGKFGTSGSARRRCGRAWSGATTIGLTLTVPVFSGGLTESQARQAIARRRGPRHAGKPAPPGRAQRQNHQTRRSMVSTRCRPRALRWMPRARPSRRCAPATNRKTADQRGVRNPEAEVFVRAKYSVVRRPSSYSTKCRSTSRRFHRICTIWRTSTTCWSASGAPQGSAARTLSSDGEAASGEGDFHDGERERFVVARRCQLVATRRVMLEPSPSRSRGRGQGEGSFLLLGVTAEARKPPHPASPPQR